MENNEKIKEQETKQTGKVETKEDINAEQVKEFVKKKFKSASIFNFDKMLTPIFIKWIFIFSLIVIFITGIVMIIKGVTARYGGGGQVITGLLTMIIGPLVARIQCELFIVIFKIHESLVILRDKK